MCWHVFKVSKLLASKIQYSIDFIIFNIFFIGLGISWFWRGGSMIFETYPTYPTRFENRHGVRHDVARWIGIKIAGRTSYEVLKKAGPVKNWSKRGMSEIQPKKLSQVSSPNRCQENCEKCKVLEHLCADLWIDLFGKANFLWMICPEWARRQKPGRKNSLSRLFKVDLGMFRHDLAKGSSHLILWLSMHTCNFFWNCCWVRALSKNVIEKKPGKGGFFFEKKRLGSFLGKNLMFFFCNPFLSTFRHVQRIV